MYQSTHLNSSKGTTEFREFPIRAEVASYPHHSEMRRYFHDYARQFRLYEHYQFDTRVLQVQREQDGWKLISERNGEQGEWQQINRHLLLGTLLPGTLIGTSLGYWLLPYLDTQALKVGFGALIIWFAGRELWRLRRASALPQRPSWLTRVITIAAGLSHGLFASGGPLLVYGLAGTQLDKARLRATLVTVWFTLNSLLTLAFLLDGRLLPALPQALTYAPLLLLGVWLAERLHRRFDERHFRLAIYILLLVTATLLLAPWRLP